VGGPAQSKKRSANELVRTSDHDQGGGELAIRTVRGRTRTEFIAREYPRERVKKADNPKASKDPEVPHNSSDKRQEENRKWCGPGVKFSGQERKTGATNELWEKKVRDSLQWTEMMARKPWRKWKSKVLLVSSAVN